MNKDTMQYLEGRFSDYYARIKLELPPNGYEREWAYIPWKLDDSIMSRHNSLQDLGRIDSFLNDITPQHMYFSAGKYRQPSINSMQAKDWQGADLVFDLDADHFPNVEHGTSKREMLSVGKDKTQQLVEFLEDDFAFDNIQIVFSGNRGYHVHIRDEEIQQLGADARQEVADYVEAKGIDPDCLKKTVTERGVTQTHLNKDGGWGEKIYTRLMEIAEEVQDMSEEDGLELLTEYDNIGENRANTILGALKKHPEKIQDGNIEVGGSGIKLLVNELADEVSDKLMVPIDEPVTTDVHRLIRLPQSLHGGSGLIVTRIQRKEFPDFDPLTHTIPECFKKIDIDIQVTEDVSIYLNGNEFELPEGEHNVPEYLGIHLMASGRGEKLIN